MIEKLVESGVMLAPAPPLPPEIWNLAVVLTVCILLGWMARLLRLTLTAADVRFAVDSQAVLRLQGLGARFASLYVLQRASMWHFHQLLRTTTEATSAKMTRIQIPFDVDSSSIDIKREGGAGASTELHFRVRSQVACTAQVFWGVQSESLDKLASTSGFASSASTTNGGSSTASPRHLIPQVLRQISVNGTMRALRTAPSRLGSRIRRQRRRHELRDDNITDDGPVAEDSTAEDRESTPGSGKGVVFTSHSAVIKWDASQADSDVIIVPVPPAAAACPAEEEIESLMEEVANRSPRSNGVQGSPVVAVAPRYSAVIVLRASASTQESVKDGLFGKLNGRQRSTVDAATAIAHCVALDFLPTPLKPERFTPAIVKKTTYTSTAAYTSQEIYGRDAAASECAICLEGVVSVVLLPCRHFCVCRVCLQEIDRCPICRATFATYIGYDGGNDDGGDMSSVEGKMGSDGD